jgi:hypothetical protein
VKIRGIKPEFWTDEKVVEVSAFARLVFLGLWNMACDNGHLEDNSRRIKMTILPADDVSCADLLRELEAIGLIEREDGWITIPTLPKHQKIDRRYFRACDHVGCTAPPLKSENEAPAPIAERKTRRGHAVVTPLPRRDHAADGEGDGDGESDKRTQPTVGSRSPRGSRMTTEWEPSEKCHETVGAEFVDLDLSLQLDSFRDYWISRGEIRKDWDAAFRNWCRKAREFNHKPTNGARRTNGLTDDEWQAAFVRAQAADLATGDLT